MIRSLAKGSTLLAVAFVVACQPQSPPSTQKTSSQAGGADEPAAHAAGHHDSGITIPLGTVSAGSWSARASRDASPLSPGGEASIDLWLTGGSGKPLAVRFWIGIQDATGSVKARASIEDAADPTHWHAHAEVPRTLPEGSKLWIEIEGENNVKEVASFHSKQ
jgi:hypothetical protein